MRFRPPVVRWLEVTTRRFATSSKSMRYLFLLPLFAPLAAQAQTDSFLIDTLWRSYIVHTPPGWQAGDSLPLVINMHGLGSNATQQQFYAEMNPVADTAQFVAVYPNGVDNAWNIFPFGVDDVGFIDQLIDTMHANYSVDLNRVYACGMSNGGFMSYQLACHLSERIVAIASVTGSMALTQPLGCTTSRPVPVLEIHGTADSVVPYDGTFGVMPTLDVIDYWLDKNACDSETVDSFDFPDVFSLDFCTVTAFRYTDCNDDSEVWLYRVNDGGHTWPGAFPTIVLGPTNWDIEGSVEIWNFFNKFTLADEPSAVAEPDATLLKLYPNPTDGLVRVEGLTKPTEVRVINSLGNTVDVQTTVDRIDLSALAAGVYIVGSEYVGFRPVALIK